VPDYITRQTFVDQFPRLISSARELPRKRLPFNILLISAIVRLDPERSYDEAEVNAELQRWVLEFGRNFKLEHVELRRFLVDSGYLTRDSEGSAYQLQPAGGSFTFDSGLRELDLVGLVADFVSQREARKRAHLEDSHAPSSGREC